MDRRRCRTSTLKLEKTAPFASSTCVASTLTACTVFYNAGIAAETCEVNHQPCYETGAAEIRMALDHQFHAG
jgi:hypothetical protein